MHIDAMHIEAMHIVLQTDRLILRRFTESDINDLVALDADPQVTRFISGGRPTTRMRVEIDFLPRYLAQYAAGERYGRWAVIERSSGAFLGLFHFRPATDRPSDEPELGFRLRRSAWGKGYASEGAQALIDVGFTELGAERVVAQTMAVNVSSRRVLEKIGLRQVRTFRMEWPFPIEGSEHGDVEYAITRAEWEQQNRS